MIGGRGKNVGVAISGGCATKPPEEGDSGARASKKWVQGPSLGSSL